MRLFLVWSCGRTKCTSSFKMISTHFEWCQSYEAFFVCMRKTFQKKICVRVSVTILRLHCASSPFMYKPFASCNHSDSINFIEYCLHHKSNNRQKSTTPLQSFAEWTKKKMIITTATKPTHAHINRCGTEKKPSTLFKHDRFVFTISFVCFFLSRAFYTFSIVYLHFSHIIQVVPEIWPKTLCKQMREHNSNGKSGSFFDFDFDFNPVVMRQKKMAAHIFVESFYFFCSWKMALFLFRSWLATSDPQGCWRRFASMMERRPIS